MAPPHYLPALRERIARHALPPGAKLLESELSREFGVSRAKVRDAFGALEQRGLIRRMLMRIVRFWRST